MRISSHEHIRLSSLVLVNQTLRFMRCASKAPGQPASWRQHLAPYQRPTTVGSGMSSPSQLVLIRASCTIPALGLNTSYSANPVDWVNHTVLASPFAIRMRHVLPDP